MPTNLVDTILKKIARIQFEGAGRFLNAGYAGQLPTHPAIDALPRGPYPSSKFGFRQTVRPP